MEQTADKLVEMTLESAPEATTTGPTPLVGTATAEDSDSDSEPAVDIDEYIGEDEDPVFLPLLMCHMTVTWPLLHRLLHQLRIMLHPLNQRRWGSCALVHMTSTSLMTTSTGHLDCGCLAMMRGRDLSQKMTCMRMSVR